MSKHHIDFTLESTDFCLSYVCTNYDSILKTHDGPYDHSTADEICITFKNETAHKILKDKIIKYFSKKRAMILLVSEYGTEDRLHYHGIVRFNKSSDSGLFQTWCVKHFGRTRINAIRDANAYLTYICKEIKIRSPNIISINNYYPLQRDGVPVANNNSGTKPQDVNLDSIRSQVLSGINWGDAEEASLRS